MSNPRDLSACLPFDVHHHSLISEGDRQTLLDGKTVTKIGYEEHFDRNIMGLSSLYWKIKISRNCLFVYSFKKYKRFNL